MPIDFIVDGPVAKVVINRPEKLNALDWEMREDLTKHFHNLRYDESIRAIIVTGGGKAFCSGADVERMGKQDLRAARERTQAGGHALIRALHVIEKLVIAAVRGVAVGIGWSIALACDITIASETARFSQIYRKVGLVPDGGACWFLMRLLGMARAKELFFSARFVNAPEALALGLVNHVVPDDQLEAKAEELARDYAEGPTFTFGMGKKLMHMAAGPSLEDFLEYECLIQPQMNNTVDHHEGVAAFKEKRKPKFQGR